MFLEVGRDPKLSLLREKSEFWLSERIFVIFLLGMLETGNFEIVRIVTFFDMGKKASGPMRMFRNRRGRSFMLVIARILISMMLSSNY